MAHLPQIGWLCGSTFAGFYPQSTEEERQHAAQTDASLLVGNPEHHPAFVEDWMGGFQAAQANRAAQQAQTGRCPCCGQAEVPLSDVTIIVGQLGPASQVELVPEPVCFACAELEPVRRFSLSLARSVHAPAASRMVLSLLVSESQPAYTVAERVIATFPSVDEVVTLRAVEGQVALLVAQLTPVQFAWISQLVAQGCVVAVGLSLVESPYAEQGHR